ncbi:MAG TPA: toll/interleukin-1 receptor domain-containing protein, partial [Methylocystis sp.]|nr:toll/interleukin-1 receptor domain-containing protein [Methylocystis sp.]
MKQLFRSAALEFQPSCFGAHPRPQWDAGRRRGFHGGYFVSHNSSDRDWAEWIGKELIALGHAPHIDAWEIE